MTSGRIILVLTIALSLLAVTSTFYKSVVLENFDTTITTNNNEGVVDIQPGI